MSYKRAFQQNPRAFMADNIVTAPDNPDYLPPNKIVKITIQKLDAVLISNKPDGAVYSIVFADTPHSLDVYWCPYYQDDTGSAMLGTDANYVFTVSMNACSFGVGSYAEPGKVRVAHANSTTSSASYGIKSVADIEPAMIQQKKIQRAFLANKGAAQNIIAYDDYMMDGGMFNQRFRSTTFGELSADRRAWAFYTLQYLNGGVMQHKGVQQKV